jgi:hypothetical protein
MERKMPKRSELGMLWGGITPKPKPVASVRPLRTNDPQRSKGYLDKQGRLVIPGIIPPMVATTLTVIDQKGF